MIWTMCSFPPVFRHQHRAPALGESQWPIGAPAAGVPRSPDQSRANHQRPGSSGVHGDALTVGFGAAVVIVGGRCLGRQRVKHTGVFVGPGNGLLGIHRAGRHVDPMCGGGCQRPKCFTCLLWFTGQLDDKVPAKRAGQSIGIRMCAIGDNWLGTHRKFVAAPRQRVNLVAADQRLFAQSPPEPTSATKNQDFAHPLTSHPRALPEQGLSPTAQHTKGIAVVSRGTMRYQGNIDCQVATFL